MSNGLRLVTPKVAGHYLGVTDRTIRRYASVGLIQKYYVLGSPKMYLVSLDELDKVEEKINQRILAQHEWAKSYGKDRFAKHGMAIFKGKA